MFLRHVSLKNIRSVCELELPVKTTSGGRSWTYVLGENGLGKSTVLRSIVLALSGGDALAELVGKPDEWIRLGQDKASITIVFATKNGQSRTARLDFKRGSSLREFLHENTESLKSIDAAISKAERNYFVAGYGVARRSGGEQFVGSTGHSFYRTARAQAVSTLFSSDAVLVSLEQWAMDMDYRHGETGLAAVKHAFNSLLKDVEFDGIDREARQLRFRTSDGVLPLAALSDGYQAMAAWCGDLLYRITETFKDYEDPLEARGLLLVDELDLHLHPMWQRRLVEFLKETFPNLQVIASTHSPLTIHQAGEGELFVLRRKLDAGAVLEAFEGAPNKLMLHQLVQSPMFGLDTLDSPQVAQKRQELRELQGIGERADTVTAPSDKRRIKKLKAELADVPNWSQVPAYMERTNAVLEKLARQLAGDSNDPNPVDTVVARATRGARRRTSS